MTALPSLPGVSIAGKAVPGVEAILSADSLGFLADLVREFAPRVAELLALRRERQARFDAGELPDFLVETAAIRASEWTVARLPDELLDRRVEITGPTDKKMIINALNSGARVFMADFEDSTSPTFENLIAGQRNLMEAVRRTLRFDAPDSGKRYVLNDRIATLMVRPRGWHLLEKHLLVDGQAVPASLFDFGLFLFHNSRAELERGTAPYFYLPKLESHREAKLWNDVFLRSQQKLGIPQGTIKATVLIETLPAAFEMDEILWELREHSAGLNCGRWDYIFSFIKKLRSDPARVLPDRGQLTMDRAFLHAYSLRLIETCHRRGVHAMGGMAAQIPIKGDEAANEVALARVRADKLREVTDGHDGTWVAHPALVPIAMKVFDQHMLGKHQIHRKLQPLSIGKEELLRIHSGTRTDAGLRHNVRVGVQYLEAWLGGSGCVPIYHLMEDAATAEIARAQVWQWLRFRSLTDDGEPVTRDRFDRVVEEEMARVRDEVGSERFDRGRFAEARALFVKLSTSESFEEFLTLPAYDLLIATKPAAD